MKLRDSLVENNSILLQADASTWQEAVKLSVDLLVKADVVEPRYYQAILDGVAQHGPYFVIAPGLAMPHARPEEGAKGLGLSLLKLKQGVSFGAGEFDPVDVIVMLAAPDKHSHIEMISALAELFSSDEDMEKLHQANTLEDIKTIIDRF